MENLNDDVYDNNSLDSSIYFIQPNEFSYMDDLFQQEIVFEQLVKSSKISCSKTKEVYNKISQVQLYQSLNPDNQKVLDLSTLPIIGPISTVEYLIESTITHSNTNIVYEDYNCMSKLISSWRRINGDGNCFHRSIMFSVLETTVFNRDVLFIKYLMIMLSTMIDNLDKLRKYSIYQKLTNDDFIESLNNLNLLYESLDSDDETSYTYNLLLQSFMRNVFDSVMNVLFRYMMYLFLEENKTKMYSHQFSINLGNLLPSQFEDSNGLANFEEYYKNELFVDFTYAEKLIIYVTCFVLNINLHLINYDYSMNEYIPSSIDTKIFYCGLKQKEDVFVIYSKNHYDVGYSKAFYDKNVNNLSLFCSLHEDIVILKDEKGLESHEIKGETHSKCIICNKNSIIDKSLLNCEINSCLQCFQTIVKNEIINIVRNNIAINANEIDYDNIKIDISTISNDRVYLTLHDIPTKLLDVQYIILECYSKYCKFCNSELEKNFNLVCSCKYCNFECYIKKTNGGVCCEPIFSEENKDIVNHALNLLKEIKKKCYLCEFTLNNEESNSKMFTDSFKYKINNTIYSLYNTGVHHIMCFNCFSIHFTDKKKECLFCKVSHG